MVNIVSLIVIRIILETHIVCSWQYFHNTLIEVERLNWNVESSTNVWSSVQDWKNKMK